jgi:hypothetical protein
MIPQLRERLHPRLPRAARSQRFEITIVIRHDPDFP